MSRAEQEEISSFSQDDKVLSSALFPIVKDAVITSIRENSSQIIEMLLPAIAIRIKVAISDTLNTMVKSLADILDNSFSARGLRWRIEAWRSGKTFAEVVFLHNLVFRVEKVLLIHNKTGLLLAYSQDTTAGVSDPVQISSLLSAVRDFVHDSFGIQSNEGLRSMQVGDLTVWIEPGPLASIAGFIRGSAPIEVRSIFQSTLDKIHRDRPTALEAFKGNTQPFESARNDLVHCLAAQYRPKEKLYFTKAYLFLALLLVILSIWIVGIIQRNLHWKTYLTLLKTSPGIVVIHSEKQLGKYKVQGLRDPLAVNPNSLIQNTKLKPESVINDFQPFISMEPELMLARVKTILNPPPEVKVQFENGTILLTGSAPLKWIQEAKEREKYLSWLARWDNNNLIDDELLKIISIKQSIERRTIHFSRGSAVLTSSEKQALKSIAATVIELSGLALSTDRMVTLGIVGRADLTGTEEANSILKRKRALNVVRGLVAFGVNRHEIVPILEESKVPNTQVNFKVLLNN